jgi:hypothetical protein
MDDHVVPVGRGKRKDIQKMIMAELVRLIYMMISGLHSREELGLESYHMRGHVKVLLRSLSGQFIITLQSLHSPTPNHVPSRNTSEQNR